LEKEKHLIQKKKTSTSQKEEKVWGPMVANAEAVGDLCPRLCYGFTQKEKVTSQWKKKRESGKFFLWSRKRKTCRDSNNGKELTGGAIRPQKDISVNRAVIKRNLHTTSL